MQGSFHFFCIASPCELTYKMVSPCDFPEGRSVEPLPLETEQKIGLRRTLRNGLVLLFLISSQTRVALQNYEYVYKGQNDKQRLCSPIILPRERKGTMLIVCPIVSPSQRCFGHSLHSRFFLGTCPKEGIIPLGGGRVQSQFDSLTTSTSFLRTLKINRDGDITFINAWDHSNKISRFCRSRIGVFFSFWLLEHEGGEGELEGTSGCCQLDYFDSNDMVPLPFKRRTLTVCALPRDKQSLDCSSCLCPMW